MFSVLSYQLLSTNPGVYLFLNSKSEVLYVGKAKNLKKRVSSYFINKNLGPKTLQLVSQIKNIKTIEVESEVESLLLEANLIKKYNPKYNSKLTDGKSYPYVLVDAKDKYPKVLVIRRPKKNDKYIFGPFPNSGTLRTVLKLIRRIFPYQSVLNHTKKICLYNHLGLCPCPPLLDKEEMAQYKKNINYIVKFLEGNTKSVVKDLEDERNKYATQEEFEKAKNVQTQINQINLITSPFNNPFEYEENPNLREDLRFAETESLKNILILNNVLVNNLDRIECYDISNVSGTNAVGSMVVFTNGEKNTSLYRKFKIKNPPLIVPNDFAMMEEVLERRLRHDEWETPSLLVVDGGKGQISAAKKVLTKLNRKIPLIGLAKKEETIITSEFLEIKLSKNSEALKLLMRIRDEAHRFAINYHRTLRSKTSLKML